MGDTKNKKTNFLDKLIHLYSDEKDAQKTLTPAEKAERDLLRAHRMAERIIEQAAKKSIEMIDDTAFVDAYLKKEISLEIKNAISDIADELKKNTSKAFKDVLNEFSKDLRKELASSQKELNKMVKEEFKQTQEMLDSYKKEQIKQSEELISKRVEEISQKVFHSSLSKKDHKKLVVEALQKAKDNNAFEQELSKS